MTLITVLIGLFIEHFVGYLDDFRRLDWFRDYRRWLSGKLGGLAEGPLGVLLLLIPPVVGVWIVYGIVDGVMLGLLEIIFGVVVLLYCLGPKDLEGEVDAFVEASAMNDETRLMRVASDLTENEVAEENAHRVREIVECIFVQANCRTFAVLFWFIVLGPVGAALYRAARLLAEAGNERESMRVAAAHWVAMLDWAPARLTALGFALTGRFEDSLPILRKYLVGGWEGMAETNTALLREVGAQSVQLGEDESLEGLDATGISLLAETAMNLLTRTLVVWVTVLALMTIGGWAT